MQRISRTISVLAVVAAVSALIVVPALASARPIVTGLSAHRGPYWGGASVTVRGQNFTGVESVSFGHNDAWSVQEISPTKLTVTAPYHAYDTVFVRVQTGAGESSRSSAAQFRFTRPSMNDPIQGGMTAHQEQRRSASVQAHHHNAQVAPGSKHWTPVMGLTAVHRAQSWIGVPYSWAGGNGSGPTQGVCAHNGGDLDCHVVGFDCSGLTLYSWWPYEHLDHSAATQHHQAGSFHPSIRQLVPGDLVFFSGYIADGIGHTAIYAGHGMVVQAPESGSQVMRSRLADVIAESGVYRGATRPMTSGQQGSGPTVSSVTPTVSAKGGKVTITGHGLTGITSVSFGHSIVYSFARQTNGRLVVNAPAHDAGKLTVAVSNAWGTVRRSLTYVAAPTLTKLSPASGSVTGGNTVTVHGRDLHSATRATVNGRAVRLHVLDANQAVITMPAHVAGPVAVALTSPFGTSNPLRYTYVAPIRPTPTPTPSTPTSGTPTSGTPTSGTPTSGTPTSGPPTSSTPPSATPTSSAPTTSAPSSGASSASPSPSPTSRSAGSSSGTATASPTQVLQSVSGTGSSPPG